MRFYVSLVLIILSLGVSPIGWAVQGTPVAKINSCKSLLSFEPGSTQRPELQDSADLFEDTLNKLIRLMKSDDVKAHVVRDRYVRAQYIQLQAEIASVKLNVPGGHYPYAGTLECINNIEIFLSLVKKDSAAPISLSQDLTWMPADFNPEASRAEDIAYVKTLLSNPEPYYQKFRTRLETQGVNAAFPELSASVLNLVHTMMNESLVSASKENLFLGKLRERALERLGEVVKAGLPYRRTIDAIQNGVAMLDVFERGRPGAKLPPLYHGIKWQYHAHIMKAEVPVHILFPTQYSLGVSDLMKVRGVPIGLVGIGTEPQYADGFFQSPLEFWFHDINHSRRAWQQFGDRAKELKLSIEEYSRLSNQFVREEIFPVVQVHRDDTELTKNLKRLAKVLLFEVSHEEALPLDREMLKWALARRPFDIGKFIFETKTDDKIKYFTVPLASVETVTFRKLEGDFYDMGEMRIQGLGGSEVRTRDMVAKAAQWLNSELNLGIPPEVLDANVRDDSGMPNDLRAKLVHRYETDPAHTAPINETIAIEDWKKLGRQRRPVPFLFDASGQPYRGNHNK